MFPVSDCDIRSRIYDEILVNYLQDTAKSRILNRDGTYTRAHQTGDRLNGRRFAVQDFFIQLAEGKQWHPAAMVNGDRAAQKSPASAKAGAAVEKGLSFALRAH